MFVIAKSRFEISRTGSVISYNLIVLLEDISAIYTIDFCLHSPSIGQAVFITFWIGSGRSIGLWQGGKKLFVVAQDDRGHIWHTAITNFDIVFAAYLVEPVMFREILRY